MTACQQSEAIDANEEPTLLAPSAPAAQPVQGGTLIIPIPHNPLINSDGVKTTPLSITTEEMLNMFSLIYEPMLKCDSANKLVPCLAEKWTADESGTVWTFQLRQNIKWHNGRAFTADDVLYTVDALRAVGSDSYYGKVLDIMESIEKVDNHTVRISMKSAGIMPLYELCFPILCRSAKEDWIGTGPYCLKAKRDGAIELAINENWWKQAPYISHIICLEKESNDIALASYSAGQLNLVPTSSLSAGKYREEGRTAVLDVNTQEVEVILFNHSNSILKDKNIRKAIAYGINRNSIISNVYLDHATVADVPVPPDSYLYLSASKIYDFNLAYAASLLEESGWSDQDDDGILEQSNNSDKELELTLLVNESTTSSHRKNAAAAVSDQLAQLGIKVNLETAAYTSFSQNKTEFEMRLQEKDFDIAMVGFNLSANGDLSAYLAREGNHNYGGYSSNAMEELLEKVKKASDENIMREVHAQLQTQFVQDLPFVVLYFRNNSIVYDTAIQNIADIREPDIFRTVDKWYMKTAD